MLIYIIGDINWYTIDGCDYMLPSNTNSDCEQCICDNLAFNGFVQFNNIVSGSDRILDLVFCNNNLVTIEECLPLIEPYNVYHPSFTLRLYDGFRELLYSYILRF